MLEMWVWKDVEDSEALTEEVRFFDGNFPRNSGLCTCSGIWQKRADRRERCDAK